MKLKDHYLSDCLNIEKNNPVYQKIIFDNNKFLAALQKEALKKYDFDYDHFQNHAVFILKEVIQQWNSFIQNCQIFKNINNEYCVYSYLIKKEIVVEYLFLLDKHWDWSLSEHEISFITHQRTNENYSNLIINKTFYYTSTQTLRVNYKSDTYERKGHHYTELIYKNNTPIILNRSNNKNNYNHNTVYNAVTIIKKDHYIKINYENYIMVIHYGDFEHFISCKKNKIKYNVYKNNLENPLKSIHFINYKSLSEDKFTQTFLTEDFYKNTTEHFEQISLKHDIFFSTTELKYICESIKLLPVYAEIFIKHKDNLDSLMFMLSK